MGNIRIIMKSLLKRKTSTLLIGIQVAISMWLFIAILSSIQCYFYLNKIPSSYSQPSEQVIHIQMNPDTTTANKYFEFRSRLLKEGNVKFIGFYRIDEIFSVRDLNKNGSFQKLNIDLKEISQQQASSTSNILSGVTMEKGVQSLKNIKIIKGRNFTDSDFENKKNSYTPVIAGYKLAEYKVFGVGSKFYDKNTESWYEVVGIMDENSTWFTYTPREGKFIYLSDKIVVPGNDSYYNIGGVSLNYYCVVDSSKNVAQVINNINFISEKVGISLESKTLKEEIKEEQDKLWRENVYWLTFSIFFIVMTSLGIAITIIYSLLIRKSEIGIRIATGASIKMIQKLFIGEIVTVVLFSSIITILYSIYTTNYSSNLMLYDKAPDGNYISFTIMIISIIATFVMTITPVIAVILKLRKLQPRELIGGKD